MARCDKHGGHELNDFSPCPECEKEKEKEKEKLIGSCDEHGNMWVKGEGCYMCREDDQKVEEKPEPTRILIKDSLKTELKALQRQTQQINEKTSSLVSGYLMALGHEGHKCIIDDACDFLTLIPKEKTNDGEKRD